MKPSGPGGFVYFISFNHRLNYSSCRWSAHACFYLVQSLKISYVFKVAAFSFLFLFYFLLVSISLIVALMFMISFFVLTLSFACSYLVALGIKLGFFSLRFFLFPEVSLYCYKLPSYDCFCCFL